MGMFLEGKTIVSFSFSHYTFMLSGQVCISTGDGVQVNKNETFCSMHTF